MYYKVTPTRHIHTGTHIQAGSRHSQKEKNRGLKIIYLKKTIKKMFRPSTTTTTTTRLLAGNSRSKNHDTNTNEMWTLFRGRKQTDGESANYRKMTKYLGCWITRKCSSLVETNFSYFLIEKNWFLYISSVWKCFFIECQNLVPKQCKRCCHLKLDARRAANTFEAQC